MSQSTGRSGGSQPGRRGRRRGRRRAGTSASKDVSNETTGNTPSDTPKNVNKNAPRHVDKSGPRHVGKNVSKDVNQGTGKDTASNSAAAPTGSNNVKPPGPAKANPPAGTPGKNTTRSRGRSSGKAGERRRTGRSSGKFSGKTSAKHGAKHSGKPAKPGGRRLRTVDETSAGGLVVDTRKASAALIGRLDRRGRLLWSLPKGHIEPGETPEQAAVREVAEETGIAGRVLAPLGTIDYWFVAEDRRVHKTVHHFLMEAVGGELSDEDVEVTEVAWVPLDELDRRLAYADERRLVRLAAELLSESA